MRLARYMGGGRIEIVDEPRPSCPPGGLLVRTEACGLCSGELMDWYMDRKIPHVLGHEVCGEVVESDDPRFPIGARVFPHHHAPCLRCDACARGLHVHCDTWKRTKLVPGGMAEFFAVPSENLADTWRCDDLRPIDAALAEPLACVVKSLRTARRAEGKGSWAVVGLGVMGLMHMLMREGAVGYEINGQRRDWARSLGLDALSPDEATPADVVVVCPGTEAAVDLAIRVANPGGTIVLFAPFGKPPTLDLDQAYFKDLTIATSYSCGPDDTREALQALREQRVRAEQVVSDFVELDQLPEAYRRMKRGDILKAMTVFGTPYASNTL